jgi:hypothetical protein
VRRETALYVDSVNKSKTAEKIRERKAAKRKRDGADEGPPPEERQPVRVPRQRAPIADPTDD